MSYTEATVKIIAEQLRWAKGNELSTAVLLGAGMSVSAGIPLARGMIEEVKKQFPELASTCEKETYPAYMSLLAPEMRRQLIGSFVDKAKINLAHLYLGALLKEGYVDRILTTNFDPLAIRSLALFNIFPAVYDFAASQEFIPGGAAELSVFYLHGQRDGFVLLNTEKEINGHSEKVKDVFQDVGRGRCWIVIGYSGENDPVFERLAEVNVFQNKLFWVAYKDQGPAKHILEKILTPNTKCGNYVKGYDADSFFLELFKELALPEPQIISTPFSHLKELINDIIAEYHIDGKPVEPTKETRKWVEAAIRGFEEGKGFRDVEEAQKKKIDIDEMTRKIRDIWVHERFNEIDDIFDTVRSSGSPEANEYLAYALINWGAALSELAQQKEGKEAEALFKESFQKYEQALKINPELHDALYNWGTALSALAKQKEGDEAEELFKESIQKYEQALNIKPDLHEALYNWGIDLSELAKRKEGKEAEALFKESIQKYEQALKIKPDEHGALYNWGNALSDLAEIKEGEEAEALFKQSYEKYEQTLKIKPDKHEALHNWAFALSDLARKKKGEEAELLFKDSFEKYEEALKIKPDKHEAMYNWGNALSDLAKQKEGEEAEALFKECFEKYEQAMKIKPDKHEALDNWGNALSELAKQKEGEEAEALFDRSLEKLLMAEDIKEGSGAYNIACFNALRDKIKESLVWLEKALKMNPTPSRKHILADTDLDKINGSAEFNRIINLYRPE